MMRPAMEPARSMEVRPAGQGAGERGLAAAAAAVLQRSGALRSSSRLGWLKVWVRGAGSEGRWGVVDAGVLLERKSWGGALVALGW